MVPKVYGEKSMEKYYSIDYMYSEGVILSDIIINSSSRTFR